MATTLSVRDSVLSIRNIMVIKTIVYFYYRKMEHTLPNLNLYSLLSWFSLFPFFTSTTEGKEMNIGRMEECARGREEVFKKLKLHLTPG